MQDKDENKKLVHPIIAHTVLAIPFTIYAAYRRLEYGTRDVRLGLRAHFSPESKERRRAEQRKDLCHEEIKQKIKQWVHFGEGEIISRLSDLPEITYERAKWSDVPLAQIAGRALSGAHGTYRKYNKEKPFITGVSALIVKYNDKDPALAASAWAFLTEQKFVDEMIGMSQSFTPTPHTETYFRALGNIAHACTGLKHSLLTQHIAHIYARAEARGHLDAFNRMLGPLYHGHRDTVMAAEAQRNSGARDTGETPTP
jgi:hypothetical protein